MPLDLTAADFEGQSRWSLLVALSKVMGIVRKSLGRIPIEIEIAYWRLQSSQNVVYNTTAGCRSEGGAKIFATIFNNLLLLKLTKLCIFMVTLANILYHDKR